MKTFVRLLSLSLFLCLTSYGFCQSAPQGDDHHPGKMLKDLGLSDDQIKQVMDINQAFMKDLKSTRDQIKDLDDQIEAGLKADTPDFNSLNGLVDQKSGLRGDIEKKFLVQADKIHKIVGDEIFSKMSRQIRMMIDQAVTGGMGRPMGRPPKKPMGGDDQGPPPPSDDNPPPQDDN